MSWDAEPSSSAPPHAMQRQRVLTIDEFTRENRPTRMESKAQYGSTYVPIPVPLTLGETEEQYEAGFRAYTESVTQRAFKEVMGEWDMPKERQLRCSYARWRLKEFTATHGLRKAADDFEMPPRPKAKSVKSQAETEDPNAVAMRARVRQPELYAKRYVDLDEHRKRMRYGHLKRVREMTPEEKMREFGSTTVPIFVPLARGETPEIYEERFVQWIWEEEALTLEALENDPSATRERHHRMLFALANIFGHVRFVPDLNRERDDGEEIGTMSHDAELCIQRYLTFREFEKRRKDGWFLTLHTMSTAE